MGWRIILETTEEGEGLVLLVLTVGGGERGEGESTHIEREERKVHKEPSFKRKMK